MKRGFKWMRRLSALALMGVCGALAPATASADKVVDAFQQAGNQLTTGFKALMNNPVLPIVYVIEGFVLLFTLLGFLKKRREGESFRLELTTMAVVAGVLILTITFNTWTAGLWD